MADRCATCAGTGRIRTTTWEGASISERCDACHGTGAPVAVVPRLIVSCCKTGAWLRVKSLGQARAAARNKGWVDYQVEPEVGRHG